MTRMHTLPCPATGDLQASPPKGHGCPEPPILRKIINHESLFTTFEAPT